MRRRTSIIILGGAVALPLTRRRQRHRSESLAFSAPLCRPLLASFVSAVLRRFKQVGFIDGQKCCRGYVRI